MKKLLLSALLIAPLFSIGCAQSPKTPTIEKHTVQLNSNNYSQYLNINVVTVNGLEDSSERGSDLDAHKGKIYCYSSWNGGHIPYWFSDLKITFTYSFDEKYDDTIVHSYPKCLVDFFPHQDGSLAHYCIVALHEEGTYNPKGEYRYNFIHFTNNIYQIDVSGTLEYWF